MFRLIEDVNKIVIFGTAVALLIIANFNLPQYVLLTTLIVALLLSIINSIIYFRIPKDKKKKIHFATCAHPYYMCMFLVVAIVGLVVLNIA